MRVQEMCECAYVHFCRTMAHVIILYISLRGNYERKLYKIVRGTFSTHFDETTGRYRGENKGSNKESNFILSN